MVAAFVWSATGGAGFAAERPSAAKDWHAVKCERYEKAWTYALGQIGTRGLGRGFLEAHQAFLASQCTRRADVCPRSREEFALANVMVEMSMNFGTASTFAPFYCR